MIKKLLCTLMMLVAVCLGGNRVKAQIIDNNTGQVVWLGKTLVDAVTYCNNGGYVFLYNVSTGQFLSQGGSYGVQGVLSSVGMRFTIAQTRYGSTTVYTFKSRIDNAAQGEYMSPNGQGGTNIYLDRTGTHTDGTKYSRPNWQGTNTTGSQTINGTSYTTNTYKFNNQWVTSSNKYLGANTNNSMVVFVGQNGANNNWRIITEEDFEVAMNNVTWGEVDLGSYLKDPDFARDNKDARYWVWEGEGVTTGTDSEGQTITLDAYSLTGNIHWHQRNQDKMCNGINLANGISRANIGTNVAGTGGNYDHDGFRNAFARYYSAEIYNEKIKLTQTLTLKTAENLSEGLYKMTAQALYYDDIDGLTNDGVAFFYLKREDAEGNVVEEWLPIIPKNKVQGNNITPHSGVSAGYVFDGGAGADIANAYNLEFFIEVKNNTKLTLGIEMREAKGWAVIGNVHLFAHGKQALFVDEDWKEVERLTYIEHEQQVVFEGDPYYQVRYYDKYDYPTTLYYQRTLALKKWNTICLPYNVTGAQVRNAFGENARVSEYDGLSEDGSCIKFKAHDLDVEGMVADVPYIIWPDLDEVPLTEITMEVGNGNENHTVTVEGPIFPIYGLRKDQSMTYQYSSSAEGGFSINTPQTITGSDGNTQFISTFYRTDISVAEQDADDYWVITKGNMYHLQGSKGNSRPYPIYATYAYIKMDKETGAKIQNLQLDILDPDTKFIVTETIPIMRDEDMEKDANDAIYNMSGQRVANAEAIGLPRGIYIKNGRKFVVK